MNMPSCENGPHTDCACCAWKATQYSTIARRLDGLRKVAKLQCSQGNWNYDSYMLGLANGLLLAIATLDDSDYNPLTKPDKWLRDRPAFVAEVCDGAAEEGTCKT